MIPIDPIMSLVVVVGMLAYYALKGIGRKKEDVSGLSPELKALMDETPMRQSSEYKRYQKWLEEHQDEKRLPTIDEIVEDYRVRRQANIDARENKRRYEWWLYKHSDEYLRDMEKIERYSKG